MGWIQAKPRSDRRGRRPGLEGLETRQLLSTSTQPAPASSSFLNPNGSVNFDQVIQASQARSAYNVTGAGETVAVIDTGVNYNNPAFGSGAVGSGTNKVVAGVDFTGSPNGVLPTWEHGTGVAGLIASGSTSSPGVAPGANIVALRVFGDNNQGSFGNIASALDWVVKNHAQYNITAVNMSISDGANYATDQFATDGGVGQQITADVAALDALNIPVISAAGNAYDGKTQGMGFPSIVPDAISVTATDESKLASAAAKDQLAGDAQRLGPVLGGTLATTIAAPGVNINAPSGTSGTTTEDGTSFATPQVTGAVLLLQQMYKQAHGTLPTVSQLDSWLQAGSVAVSDPSTGLAIGRLDVLNSLQILNAQIQASQGSGTGTGTGGGTTTTTTGSGSTTGTGTGTGTGGGTTTTPAPTPPVTNPGGGSTSGGSTGTGQQAPTSPLINVVYNGQSLGSYSTTQLSTVYSRLFAFSKAPITSFQAWGPAGRALNLGGPQPTGHVARAFSGTVKAKAIAPPVVAKSAPTPRTSHLVHKAVVPLKG